MIVAIPTPGKDLSSRVDSRFGRAVGFIIYNTGDASWKHKKNILDDLAHEGAGEQAANNLLKEKVDALVSGHCGPKAFEIFSSSGVKVYSKVSGPISQALERLEAGELEELASADVQDHWS